MRRKSLESLTRGIQHCRGCERNQTRSLAVPGEGNTASGMLLVGEAPGKKENMTGLPFVGRAGDYLDKILMSHDLDRNRVFITSVLKCFHPRPPKKSQIQKCLSWTMSQIDSLNPRLILVMGKWAAWALLGMDNLEGVPIVLSREGKHWVVTCHPAAAMRFPQRDREFRQGFTQFASEAARLNLL